MWAANNHDELLQSHQSSPLDSRDRSLREHEGLGVAVAAKVLPVLSAVGLVVGYVVRGGSRVGQYQEVWAAGF